MKIIKFFSVVFAMTMFLSSCDKDNNVNPIPNGGDETDFKGILFATTITNAEGNNGTVYLQSADDMKAGTYGIQNAIPSGFGVPPLVMPSGNVYLLPSYMGNDKAEIARYEVDANGKFIKQGVLQIPANAAACNVVELNEKKAYVSMQNLGIVMAFNPTTMKKIKDIDLNSLRQSEARVSPASMIIRDNKLYVGLSQMNAQFMPNQNSIELAMIDTQTDELKKHITNKSLGMCFATRPLDPNSIFMDENKDIYISCLGAFGFIPGLNGGIVRIKNGTDEIDPNYAIRMDQTQVDGLSVGKYDFLAGVKYHKDGKLYAIGSAMALDPNAMTNPYTSMTSLPCVIDLKTKTIKAIKGMEIGSAHSMAVGIYKNMVVFGLSTKTENGFFTYDPLTGKTTGAVMKVQGAPCMFHSFVK